MEQEKFKKESGEKRKKIKHAFLGEHQKNAHNKYDIILLDSEI